ncbi:hypothetical protein MXD61_18710 [Frankia sp. AgPm24]|uniref:hypothetical protein n=1 Tax=Frankia sp. AgPm24 TaxID=631128 RepID=UPI00200E1249|nr:hypothetical protein [Frankia sp. AgPm24]MCK9923874.1 hypothetical protein [Frankia sp. AgPm24]
MADATLGLYLADVRGLSLDRLRNSSDDTLRHEVDRLLDDLDLRCAWSRRGTGDSGGCWQRLR